MMLHGRTHTGRALHNAPMGEAAIALHIGLNLLISCHDREIRRKALEEML